MEKVGRLCFAAVFLCAGLCSAAPHPRFRVIDLGVLPGGASSVATALNDKGEVVGDSGTPDGVHAFLFSNGEMTDLNAFLQFRDRGEIFTSGGSFARDINNRSEVIGGAQVFASHSEFLYADGMVSYFPAVYPYIGNQMFPIFFFLNDLGHIAGLGSSAGRPAVTDRERIWFYPSSGGAIGTKGLNNYDEVTGFFAPPGSTFTYFPALFRTNEVVKIELPEGGLYGTGWDLNDAGHVVGSFITMIDGPERVFFYRDGVTIDVGAGRPVALNNSDEAVGFNENGSFVYTGGRMFPLNEAIPQGLGVDIRQANDINNDGVIAGSAVRNGEEHAVVLIPLNRARFHKHTGGSAAHGPTWWTRALNARERNSR